MRSGSTLHVPYLYACLAAELFDLGCYLAGFIVQRHGTLGEQITSRWSFFLVSLSVQPVVVLMANTGPVLVAFTSVGLTFMKLMTFLRKYVLILLA